MIRNSIYLLILFCAVQIIGCGVYVTHQTEEMSPQDAFRLAKSLFDDGDYTKAVVEFDAFVKNHRTRADSMTLRQAYYLLALSSFRNEDWLTARADFSYFLSRGGRQDSLLELAGYYYGLTWTNTAPSPELDQTDTKQAMSIFTDLLTRNPSSASRESLTLGLHLCKEQLARKAFVTARLYYNTHDFKASIMYTDEIIGNYDGTTWFDPAVMIKARCYLALNQPDDAKGPLRFLVENSKDKDLQDEAKSSLDELISAIGAAQ
jgi:outer membrane protein assembly factor BamD